MGEQQQSYTQTPQAGRIIISGGGTGGHIFPAIAIARALQQLQPDIQILFVGAKGKMEMEKVPQAGYPIRSLDIKGMDRSNWWKNITLPYFILKSILQARHILHDFKPHAVVGVGGYASFPMLFAAQQVGIDTYIQEQNSFAGKANQWLAKKATRIFVAFDGMEKFFPKEKMMVTGNPVRQDILAENISKAEACRFFELDPQRPVVLVVGGSQGARSINRAVQQNIEFLISHQIQLIWQTGKLDYENIQQFIDSKAEQIQYRAQIKVMPFIQDMARAYAAADVVVSRAGAIAIAELCVMQKPAILVPFPFAAEDHQTHNARMLAEKQAAWMIADAEVQEKLVHAIIDLCTDEEKRKNLSEHIGKLAIRNADKRIAETILQDLKRRYHELSCSVSTNVNHHS
ncbi:undecaprenyldiphospho-muramoylpentapeptide beta-N-acetylglucosaminyltransferase [Thermoflavifilum thermophilum]|uniref:UDP-N-acetylglucosamine--N-acetylmuramyl-(pentapeptide) pyrophosphoryl-undecaprenol N-acetylglucosamine transferase n=1 Tax=Thermoflavifilum thermophilum TaxID=1393122 RepID=A0A1I7N4A4_9BACT|nr:undecaprenyldiphospho-muramoylpentapeptide beta-N-acetylglucosaminyltransferase [Thermoflavifilum thermophilum]SFV29481.1 UDP-N-acetylglucosamine-N-acetylmuramylpentapeptide N-acetylglucosamine transferase [Thermoflavifilum thermophilum]